MQKMTFPVAALSMVMTSVALGDAITITQRCQASDSLHQGQAIGRNEWYKKNYPGEIQVRMQYFTGDPNLSQADALVAYDTFTLKDNLGADLEYARYPTFLVKTKNEQGRAIWTDPLTYVAPVDPAVGANKPQGYVWAADCRAGCFQPWVRVLFKKGYLPIKSALENGVTDVMAFAKTGTLEAPSYRALPVAEYTQSMRDEWNDILRIETEGAGVLEVTPNHPLVDGEGHMREAATLTASDELVRVDGSRERIVSITKRRTFGKVYNVSPKSTELKENVLVAEGFLTGSAWYQNEGHRNMNRLLLRANLTSDVFNDSSSSEERPASEAR